MICSSRLNCQEIRTLNEQTEEKASIESLLLKTILSIKETSLKENKEFLWVMHSITTEPHLKSLLFFIEIKLLQGNSSIAQAKSKINNSGRHLLYQKEFKENLAISNEKKDHQDYSYVMLFALLTLLALLVMSFYTNNRLRAKNNRELEKKNRSLTIERDRAQNAARIKSDFLSTITHELRTPMYAVTGLTHLLLENKPRADQKEHLETLKSSGEYLLSLINNILDYNKLEAKKAEIEVIPFNLKKRLEGIVKSLKQQADKQGNQLHLEFDSNLPEMVKGDPIKISQIVINLLSNAIKFTKNGNIYIRSNVIEVNEVSKLIQFEIEDNGKGISLDKQESIFDFFSQEDSSTIRKYGGSGLGLAIVSNLIELLGGHIELDSELGRGSNFKFRLWLQSTNEKSDKNIKSHSRVKFVERNKKTNHNVNNTKSISTTAIPLNDLKNKKILIVEDNRINQLITKKILEGKNFSCDVASDGKEAIEKYRNGNFDLILMDIHMPVMDGKQATTTIRKENKNIPILALTAVNISEAEQELHKLGFDDIIPKPFKIDLFFEKIQQAFGRYESL